MSAACRWPNKMRHATPAAAKAHIADLYRSGKGNPDLGVYQCGDHWHVGHGVVHFRKCIRKSLTGGRNKYTRRTKR